MCAIIGCVINSPAKSDFDLLKRIFLESQIRGKHATGMSWLKNGEILTIKEPIPAEEFVVRHLNKLEEFADVSGILRLSGHARYSTSDLRDNQPISNKKVSVVHNGVITQELPENWEKLYGYSCETRNDTELLVHTIEEEISPLLRWKNSSLAVCELHADGRIRFYRNGKRPVYYSFVDNGIIVTSTIDIARRAGLTNTKELDMNVYAEYDGIDLKLTHEIISDARDLQHV